jgi:hypothetical protein
VNESGFDGRTFGGGGANVPGPGLGGRVTVTVPLATLTVRNDGAVALTFPWPSLHLVVPIVDITQVCRVGRSGWFIQGGIAISRGDGDWIFFWCGRETAEEIAAVLAWFGAPVDPDERRVRSFTPFGSPGAPT